jgi:hypothetical protein
MEEFREEIDSLNAIPRYLVHCFTKNNNRFYLSPETTIRGNALRRSPRNLKRILKGTANYRKWLDEEKSYDPKFPWPEDLLEEDPKNIPKIFRGALKKSSDSAYLLFDVRPDKVFGGMKLTGNEIDALVKSKGKRRRTRPNYHISSIQSVFLDENHEPDLRHITCNCEDHSYDFMKPGDFNHFFMDIHSSALMSELEERMITGNLNPPGRAPLKVKGKISDRPLFSPYTFTSNWYYDKEGNIMPRNKHLAALEGDALLTYYVFGGENDDCYGINERLFRLWETCDPSMSAWFINKLVTRRVLTQRREADTDLLPQFGKALNNFFGNLNKYGYKLDGHCREMGSTATHYVNEATGNSVNVQFSDDGLPFYSVREPIEGSIIRPFDEYSGERNPFKFMGRRSRSVDYDDVTMRDTFHRVNSLAVFKVPESGFEQLPLGKAQIKRYRDKMREANNGENINKEKMAWVHYL